VNTSGKPNILLLNLNHIGDVLFTTPAVKALRQAYPEGRITCLVSEGVAETLRGNPHIDSIIARSGRTLSENARIGLSLRSKRFDLSICFTFSSYKLAMVGLLAGAKRRVGFNYTPLRPFLNVPVADNSAQHRVKSYLDLVRAVTPVEDDFRMEMFVSEEDRVFADELLSRHGYDGRSPLVGINPGATVSHNRWMPDRFASVGDRLQKQGATAVIFGGPSDVDLAAGIAGGMSASPIVVAGQTTIGQAAALISRCRALISGDTGPLHMAVSLGVPYVAIFGPADPNRTGPYASNGAVLWDKPQCAPCWRKPTCESYDCMDAITADNVFAATESLLSSGVGVP
jgi:heptosyltransferase II